MMTRLVQQLKHQHFDYVFILENALKLPNMNAKFSTYGISFFMGYVRGGKAPWAEMVT